MVYFFNLAGAVYDPDVEGVELASLGEARVRAAKYASDVLLERPDVVWTGEELRIEVTDARQLVLFTLIIMGVDAPVLSAR